MAMASGSASGAPRSWPSAATARRRSCATTIPAQTSGTSPRSRADSRRMRLEDFDYPFDESLIAQHPIEPRDHARLLVVDRRSGALAHHRFDELPTLLLPNDLLVLNDTQVIPARLPGRKRPSGGKIEVLLVRPLTLALSPQAGRGEFLNSLSPGGRGQGEGETWHALVRGRLRP